MGVKRERYIEASSRIESAIKTGHYFEAITIQESIISDRIASFLVSTDTLSTKEVYGLSFFQLISFWKMATRSPGNIWEPCDNLIGKVNSWRKNRNDYVHGLVKFPQQKPLVVDTKTFISGAKSTALAGKKLSSEVSEWRKRQSYLKRAYNKSIKSNAMKKT